MSWIIFALIAPFFWAISNFFDKFAISKITRGIYDFIFFGTIGAFLLLVILFVFNGFKFVSNTLFLMGVTAGLLLNYSYILYAKALSGRDTSEIIPMFQIIPIFTLIIGFLFFDEYVTGLQLAGFIFVLLGISILSTEKRSNNKFSLKKEFWLMVLSSLLISISFLFTDHVLERTSFWTALTYETIGFCLAGVSLFLFRKPRLEIIEAIRDARLKKYLLFFGNDGADILGQLSMKTALLGAPAAGLASAVGGIQPLYVILMGYGLTKLAPNIIKENISYSSLSQRIGSITLIILGIILVSH